MFWNNSISSARTLDGCANAYHYELANFRGSFKNCRQIAIAGQRARDLTPCARTRERSFDCCSDLGLLDDHTSSIVFSNNY